MADESTKTLGYRISALRVWNRPRCHPDPALREKDLQLLFLLSVRGAKCLCVSSFPRELQILRSVAAAEGPPILMAGDLPQEDNPQAAHPTCHLPSTTYCFHSNEASHCTPPLLCRGTPRPASGERGRG